MFKFTKTGIFCVFITIIFCSFQIFISQYSLETEINEEIMSKEEMQENSLTKSSEIIREWQIEIPKIMLTANISEGTTKEVLHQYVGHFVNTSKIEGNIGLAVNYFKDIKLLKQGDEIIYRYNECEKIYEVEKCRIIKDIEMEYLEETEDNMLTLITFIENQPKYRRCIQAIEKLEEE